MSESHVTDTFTVLNLPPEQVDNLTALGYTRMTPVQAQALPIALQGGDLIVQARTGSGKTAAFGIALLNRINQRDFGTQALILCRLANWQPRSPRRFAVWRAIWPISRW